MSTQTEHLKLDLREAADIFNPLSTNANFESLDNIIYEIQTKGGVPTYTTTASANLLKLSQNPTPNVTVFKFIAAGDANTWSYQETVNDIVALDGSKKTVKGGMMYVAWVNAANAMVVIAWPDVINAQTFDGKGPAEWATKAQLDAVNQAAANATQTAQAAATVANQALEMAQKAGLTKTILWENPNTNGNFTLNGTVDLQNVPKNTKFIGVEFAGAEGTSVPYRSCTITPFRNTDWMYTPFVESSYPVREGNNSYPALYIVKYDVSNVTWNGTAELSGFRVNQNNFQGWNKSIFNIFALS